MKTKYSTFRGIFQNKIVSKLFLFVLLIFVTTSLIGEWRASSNVEKTKILNSQNYQAIVKNAILLNRCYVATPDENYCFAILKVISGQLNNANFQTNNIKFLWSNTYVYLSSVALQNYPKLHDRWVRIAVNEELVSGDVSQYTPSTPENINKYQQELRAEYRAHMQLELSEKNQKLNEIDPDNNTK